MKKVLLIVVATLFVTTTFAQRKKRTTTSSTTPKKEVSKSPSSSNGFDAGQIFFEINTATRTTGNTAIGIESFDGGTNWSVGAEGGYFIIPNLAAKLGLGVGGQSQSGGESTTTFNFKVGAKYYVIGMIPVGLDFTGQSTKGNSLSWIGIQGGYLLKVNDHLGIEPALRYNLATKSKDEGGVSLFQATVGFVWFL